MKRSLPAVLAILGPGIAVAATGIGAGDMVAASVSGARFGVVVAWAAAFGALLKFALNEGIARWQLATDTTLLEGWGQYLHRGILLGFLVYLVLWTVVVAGAIMAACGLAAHAMLPGLSVAVWGALHSVVAVVLVYLGGYALFERLVKVFIAVMFATILLCAFLVEPEWGRLLRGLFVPAVPEGAGPFLLGVIGGAGGSVTLLSYSYWIQERGWGGADARSNVRLDLGAAYLLTGLFGVALIVTSSGAEGEATGNQMALVIADHIGSLIGPAGKWIFLVGFWGAVFSSMLGVWQGVPYLFDDFMRVLRHRGKDEVVKAAASTTSPYYRGYLLFLGFFPMLLLLYDRPVWVIIIYSVAGAFFMPFLAGTLLYMNNRKRWVAEFKNGWVMNGLLTVSLVLFAYLLVSEIVDRF